MKSDPKIHHRRSIRLPGYDYSHPGVFCVTCCASGHNEIFGAVVDGEMQPSPLGRIVRAEWFRSAEVRREIQLFKSEFVLMPNHLHGIVWIIDLVGADGVRPDNLHPDDGRPDGLDGGAHPVGGAYHAPLQRAPRSLGSFMAGFKAAVTSRAGKELDLANIWQRNYYEHIVRNEDDLQKIRVYIHTNPQRWQEDQLHPDAPANRFNHRAGQPQAAPAHADDRAASPGDKSHRRS